MSPFTVEVERAVSASNGKTTVVGLDVGIRHLAVLSTGAPPIPNPRDRLARIHGRAANLRRDAMHKLTTLAAEHGIVVVEQLNVAGMVRNRHRRRVSAGYLDLGPS
jgi:putative transposase